jgi:hypothetical protein
VLARNWLAVELCGDQNVVVHTIFQADVGAVAVVACKEDVFYFELRFHNLGEVEERDAAPAAIEFAPSRDAVEVAYILEPWQSVEFFPSECFRIPDETADFKSPFFQRDIWANAQIEDRKSGSDVLTWRQPVLRAGGRLRLAAHLACPTFLPLDDGGINAAHEKQVGRKLGREMQSSLASQRRCVLARKRDDSDGLFNSRFIFAARRSPLAPAAGCPAEPRNPVSSAVPRKNAEGSSRAALPLEEPSRDRCALRRCRA